MFGVVVAMEMQTLMVCFFTNIVKTLMNIYFERTNFLRFLFGKVMFTSGKMNYFMPSWTPFLPCGSPILFFSQHCFFLVINENALQRLSPIQPMKQEK